MNTQKAVAGMAAVWGIGLLGMSALPTQASLAPTNPIETGSGPYTFTYSATLSATEKVLDGDFLTISGVNGYIPGTAAAAGFTATAPAGDPTAVTFTRTGGTVTGPTATPLQFLFQSTVGDIANVSYDFVDHSAFNNSALPGTGTVQGPIGTAAVPEPASMATFALGGLSLLALIVRARKTRRPDGRNA